MPLYSLLQHSVPVLLIFVMPGCKDKSKSPEPSAVSTPEKKAPASEADTPPKDAGDFVLHWNKTENPELEAALKESEYLRSAQPVAQRNTNSRTVPGKSSYCRTERVRQNTLCSGHVAGFKHSAQNSHMTQSANGQKTLHSASETCKNMVLSGL